MGIPLLSGRVFTAQDRIGTQPVVIVNQALADLYWPAQDPVGKSLHITDTDTPDSTMQIVGVVGNIKNYRLDEPTASQIYLSFPQVPSGFARLVVRTAGEPLDAATAVRQAVWSIDKDQPLWKVRTLESLLDREVGGSRFMMQLVSCFSLVALLLALVGIYGVISYSVSQRTREIGVRMALGAQRKDIIRLVVGQGAVLILPGIAIGLLGALALTQYIKSLLFNVGPADVFTYSTVSLLLAMVALVACYLPARRATKVEPMIALRHD
jgi:putative ABC transport system permease protein